MINKKKALDDFQITEQEFDEMLAEFIEQANAKIAGIEESLREGNVQEAERHAHSLKGVAGNLRLDACYSIASTIDGALRNNPPLPIEAHLVDMKKAIDEIRTSIRPQ